MRIAHRLCHVLLVAVMLVACSSIRVTVDYDPNEDFSTYRTFAWLPEGPQPTGDYRVDNDLIDSRIRAAVRRSLRSKGFTQVLEGVPDFYVVYHLSIESKLDVYSVNRGYIDYYGWGWSVPETRVREYEEGTLVIDIADPRDKELVWRGVGQGRVRQQSTPEKTTAEVNAAVAEILAAFPPGGEKS